jgi:hypothetical protein
LELVSLLGHRRSVKDITETGSMDSDARGNIIIIITKVIKIDWQRRDHFPKICSRRYALHVASDPRYAGSEAPSLKINSSEMTGLFSPSQSYHAAVMPPQRHRA